MAAQSYSVKSFETSDGTIVNYKVAGQGKPIIFIHGLFGKSGDFDEAISIVSKQYQCISYDHRGHGLSTAQSGFCLDTFAQDLKELIEHLSLADVVVVGYSLGAFTVFNYVEKFGCQYLKKIVLVDITPKMVNDASWSLGLYRGEYTQENLNSDLSTINTDYMSFASYFTYRNMTKFSNKPYRNRPTILSKILARLLIKNTPSNISVTQQLWSDVARLDHRNTLKKFEVPTAIFYADPGSLFSPETARYMQSQIPSASSLVAFTNAGHSLVFSHGKQFAEQVLVFMAQDLQKNSHA